MLTQFPLSCCSLSTDLCEIRTDGNASLVGKFFILLLKCSPSLNNILLSINVSFASFNYSGPDSFDHTSESVLNLYKRDVKFSCFISFLKKPNHIRIFFNFLALLKICSVMRRCHVTHYTCHLKNTHSTHLIPRYSLLTLLISPSLLLGNSQHSLSALYSTE